MEFPFSPKGTINQGLAPRGSGNTFWYPPMMPQTTADNEQLVYLQTMMSSNSNNVGNDGSANSIIWHTYSTYKHTPSSFSSSFVQLDLSLRLARSVPPKRRTKEEIIFIAAALCFLREPLGASTAPKYHVSY
jgi:hypothetical protein